MLVVETQNIRVETNDYGVTITGKKTGSSITLDESEAADLWRAIILQWKAHADHVW